MRKKIKELTAHLALIVLCLTLQSRPLYAQNNPVLEGVADAGVINFNGKYYLAGVATNGGYYISDDLVKWTGPVHVFSMDNDWTKGKPFGDNQIHAADIHYWNGKFHFYWSVNYWGPKDVVVHVGHAVADNILGPYVEPDKKNWFDSRIDANLFINSDSTFYFYTVKFTDGNTIWGQQMVDPWTFKSQPKYLFNSLPDTWERVDNNVNEGPWVMKYRSKYYLMYNANHTANEYGNYALGVSVADDPLGFNSGAKYTQPVVQQNLTDNPEEQRYFFTSSVEAFSNWKYTFDKPSDNWTSTGFAESGWESGDKGFGNQTMKGSTTIRPQTDWSSDDIWVRKHFTMKPAPSNHLQLLVNHTGPAEIYVDGQSVYKSEGANYATIDLSKEIIQKLKAGNNVIAIHSKKGRRGCNLDVDLVDPLNKQGDDILFNPGQPNIVKGPNGFEWWLVYFGIKNGGRRGQFIDRVLFNNQELTVDGPTGSRTAGYHPNPSQPLFGDNFNAADKAGVKAKWDIKSGKWQVQNDELTQTGLLNRGFALIKSRKSANYLFKIGVKNNSPKNGNSGIIAYYAGPNNLLEIGFNQKEGSWISRLVKDGKETIKKNKLSPQFNFDVYHSLSIYKNDTRFDVLIDDNPAPGNNKIHTSFTAQGIPGVFTERSTASFDGAIYTPGWDEYNSTITGWNKSVNDQNAKGKWVISSDGISHVEEKSNYAVFKGDRLSQYEFATQLYKNDNENTKPNKGLAGIYPIYIDKDNYLQAGIDFESGDLVVSGKLKGNKVANLKLPLKRTIAKYPDPKYGDGITRFYRLKKNTELSSLEIAKSIYNMRDFKTNTFDLLNIFYRNNGEWHPLDFKVVGRDDQAVNKIQFDKITADAIRLTSSVADNNVHVYKLYTVEDQTSDYNLRAVKLADKVVLFLDGKQVAEISGSWPASQVGLFGKDMAVTYNGSTLFEK
ncbi:family 43 glycosylhydrolase [Mucilaginibacter panaciglaebae]|uniref:Glycosyl hydrolase family 43 n=1 Tax=Mucilaginibacter panaciglaebae TaxID=502331 RepID=A0ABP7WXV2_9SPHI